MFQIAAEYSDQQEIEIGFESVRGFFSDPRNFVGLMPNLEDVTVNAGSPVSQWLVRADLPLIGALSAAFTVQIVASSPTSIEWGPAADEKANLLYYTATFEPHGTTCTVVHLKQRVEMRRERARDFHNLAGWIGERRINREVERRVAEMMRTFLERVRAKLERQS